ncbi:hypothetical protein [Lentibacillus halodurans]|nr:hypothetical protein [Lentibacillus halodurans]
MEQLPEIWVLVCAVLVFAISYTIYKVNEKLHKFGDPPWKKENGRQ